MILDKKFVLYKTTITPTMREMFFDLGLQLMIDNCSLTDTIFDYVPATAFSKKITSSVPYTCPIL